MNTSPPAERRSDLDALRAVAMLLGILLHGVLSFFPAFWVVSDSRQEPALGLLVSALHGFRMPVFFVMSGYFSALLLDRRGRSGLLRQRARRILLPLFLGMVTVVPAIWWVSSLAMQTTPKPSPEPAPAATPTDTLWAAAEAGDLAAIDRHLAAGADVNAARGDSAVTPLHLAALADRPEAVALLIQKGARPDTAAVDGGTPLHAAAFVGHERVVSTLVEQGANVNARDTQGRTPLDNATVDVPTTLYYASMLELTVVEEGLAARKAAITEYLRSHGGTGTSLAATLMQIPLLNHLWFLWFLWWLTLGLAILSAIGARLPAIGLPAWAVVSPARYLWLVPLTMIPQAFMGDGGASPLFGPDTSAGLLPIPHVLAYYAIFFGFGALDYQYDGRRSGDTGRIGRHPWIPLTIALAVVFPLGMALTLDWPAPLAARLASLDPTTRRWLSIALQAAYPWLMTFGLMGLFRRFCRVESPTMRYLSDSAYWLYLAHLPLIIGAQLLVRDWPLPALLKLALIVAAVTALLLVVYQTLVRYTRLGRLLNGPRTKPALRDAVNRAA
jgi:surface polysaccharide O-acyltransferase-like enzyme